MIVYAYMPGQEAVIGDYILIADDYVMAHMASRHEEVVITDARPPTPGSAAVDSDVFAQVVAAADPHPALQGGVKGEILWVSPNDRCAADVISRAKLDLAAQLGMCGNSASGSDFGRFGNNCVGPDLNAIIKLGALLDDGGFVNHDGLHCLR